MNPFYLLLFSFLAVSFSLILIQKEMRIWEKFCLLINPALLVLVLVYLELVKLDPYTPIDSPAAHHNENSSPSSDTTVRDALYPLTTSDV